MTCLPTPLPTRAPSPPNRTLRPRCRRTWTGCAQPGLRWACRTPPATTRSSPPATWPSIDSICRRTIYIEQMTEGTFFVLAALVEERLHGYGIVERARTLSADHVKLTTGTLYGILDRLTAGGLVA